MRKRMLAGNWKMNKANAELPAFFEGFAKEAGFDKGPVAEKVDVLFAPPTTLLAKAAELARPHGIRIAAQNIHWEESGAFTGEISITMLKDIGVDATLIGHSERRQYFGETDATVTKKTQVALAAGIMPIVCVGETLEERKGGKTSEIISRQVKAFLEPLADAGDMVIAYEPVWAIGTGETATKEQAQEVHAAIRSLVAEKFGQDLADRMRILYGGSAKPANIDELLAQSDIDGGLVGGASLKPADFALMVRSGMK